MGLLLNQHSPETLLPIRGGLTAQAAGDHCMGIIDTMGTQAIANITWSFGAVNVHHAKFFDTVADRLISMSSSPPSPAWQRCCTWILFALLCLLCRLSRKFK